MSLDTHQFPVLVQERNYYFIPVQVPPLSVLWIDNDDEDSDEDSDVDMDDIYEYF